MGARTTRARFTSSRRKVASRRKKLHCCPPVVRKVLFDTDHELRSSFGEAARSVVLILWVRQESVAGHEYARPNTGGSITPGSSGNGALPTHQSEKGENNDNEENNRLRTLHTGCSAIHMMRRFAYSMKRQRARRAQVQSAENANFDLDKPVAISCLK